MSFVRRFGLLIFGIVLVIGGVVWHLCLPPTASFGWTAYAPLSSTTFVPSTSLYADVVAAIGALLIAGWIGFRLGRRGKTPLG